MTTNAIPDGATRHPGLRALRWRGTSALALLLTSGPAAAQYAPHFPGPPTVGWIVDDDCLNVDGPGSGGELYALKLEHAPAVPPGTDWQVHAAATGGPLVGLKLPDFNAGAYQVLGGNFVSTGHPSDAVFLYTTFRDGALHLDSGTWETYNFVHGGRVQRVGDSAAGVPGTAGIVLPDSMAPYEADLGEGPERFPRLREGWPELAFAPLVQVDRVTASQGPDWCGLGGEAVAPGHESGAVIGYNLYRVSATGDEPPPLDLLEALETWLDFIPVRPEAEPADSLARLVDPDGLPDTGDEVLVYHDAPRLPDGSVRPRGEAPVPGERNWYRIQPVVIGEIEDFEAFDPRGLLDPLDARRDFDGDGVAESVDLGSGRWGLPDKPEFTSPQSREGLTGLGLANDGLPLLSRAVGIDVPALAPPEPARSRVRMPYRPVRR